MRNEAWAAAGVIGASVLLGACSFAPTLFLLFRISVAALGQLAQLEPYRPLFIASGGSALLYAFWMAWRPQTLMEERTEPCNAGACSSAGSRRGLRQLALVALAVYSLALVYPWILAAVL
jgi:mercuric ion transport protein